MYHWTFPIREIILKYDHERRRRRRLALGVAIRDAINVYNKRCCWLAWPLNARHTVPYLEAQDSSPYYCSHGRRLFYSWKESAVPSFVYWIYEALFSKRPYIISSSWLFNIASHRRCGAGRNDSNCYYYSEIVKVAGTIMRLVRGGSGARDNFWSSRSRCSARCLTACQSYICI